MYVTNRSDGTFSVINTATNTIDATISVGRFPHGIAFDSANNRMYITNQGDNTVSVIDIAPSTTTSGGGSKSNCDSNGFGNNNSLRVYQVMYDVDTHEVQVQAYSTCGSISAKMTTPMQQSILGLSLEQTLLDDKIVIYSGYLDESEEKFNISVQNKKQSFDETFYIYDKSITKKYTGYTGYASEQQGTPLPTVTSTQTTILPETSVTMITETIEESVPIENEKQISDEKLVTQPVGYTPEPVGYTPEPVGYTPEPVGYTPEPVGYTPEPVAEEIVETTCGVGTELVDGICKIIKTDEPKFCFLFWCW
jgi:YVTN family beta-propeller protein